MITANTYGLLYNWYAVSDSRKICPEGWRVPDNNDWSELVSFPGGEDGAADKLKEKGTAHWATPKTDASENMGLLLFRVGTGWKHSILRVTMQSGGVQHQKICKMRLFLPSSQIIVKHM